MSEFSEKCKEYIGRSGTNIYRISKQSGIERTTLQRMVTGSRVPTSTVVEKFCAYLQINTDEEAELLELYKMEKIGRGKYETRKIIQEIIQGIQSSRSNYREGIILNESFQYIAPQEGVKVLKIEFDIYSAINYVIKKEIKNKENPHISMDFFPKCEWIMQQLIREEQCTNKKISSVQYLNFSKNSMLHEGIEVVNNIRILEAIIPFAFTFQNEYIPMYSYIEGKKEDDFYRVWPHFLATSSSLILFSDNSKSAILIEDMETVRGYQEELEDITNRYRPLIKNKECDVSERIEMLRMYEKSFDNEKIKSYLINDKSDNSTESIYIEIKDEKQLYIVSTSAEFKSGILCIEEMGICEAFIDYFDSLCESPNVLNIEDSKLIVTNKIQELISQLTDKE